MTIDPFCKRALLVVLAVASCARAPSAEDVVATPTGKPHAAPLVRVTGSLEAQAELRGVWLSTSYGWIVEVTTHSSRLYDYGAAGCLQVTGYTADELFAYVARDGSQLYASGARGSTRYRFDRGDALPASCLENPSEDPRAVLEYFWTVMDQHYPFFALHGVDWAARGRQARSRARSDMADAELFDLLASMLEGLDDGHTSVRATIDNQKRHATGRRAGRLDTLLSRAFADQKKLGSRGDFERAWRESYRRGVIDRVLGGQVARESGPLIWGRVGSHGQIGYVNIAGVAGFSETGSVDEEVAAAHRLVGQMIDELADTRALIVDLTVNHGGYDDVSRAIAEHFATERTLAYSKRPFRAVESSAQALYLVPAAASRYRKPVVLVTSDETVSGAEVLAMSMRALPAITHVGARTRGALSDRIPKSLPNGWMLTMSMEIYRDASGEFWEGRGIPPTEPLVIFDPERLDESHAIAIESIVAELDAESKAELEADPIR